MSQCNAIPAFSMDGEASGCGEYTPVRRTATVQEVSPAGQVLLLLAPKNRLGHRQRQIGPGPVHLAGGMKAIAGDQ